jgi:hypothetical protein
MAEPLYTEDQIIQAQRDPTYTQAESLITEDIGQQRTGLQGQLSSLPQTYAQRRAQTIRSYQDQLDTINQNLANAGIQTRAQYGGRELYNASGEVSGIGQAVGAQNLAPYLTSLRSTSEAQRNALSGLDVEEQQAQQDIQSKLSGLDVTEKQKKFDLLQSILAPIKAAATKKQEAIDTERADTISTRTEQQAKGRTYLSTPKEVAKAKKAGKTIIKIGKDFFTASPAEMLDLANTQSLIANRGRESGGGEISVTEQKFLLDQDYNASLQGASDVVVTGGDKGDGEYTREDIIRRLAQEYPHKNISDITKDVFAAYPDNFRIGQPKKRVIDRAPNSPLNRPGGSLLRK